MSSPAAKPRTVLHLGAHKTATTLLQNWLAKNRALLSAEGVGVSLPVDLENSVLERFCFELSKPRKRTVTTKNAKFAMNILWKELNAPILHIISKENLLGEAGRMYRNAGFVLSELSIALKELEVTILFYVRRQDHFIESHTLQQYAHGMDFNVDDVIQSTSQNSWSDLVHSMESHFPNRVQIRFYEKIDTGVRLFIEDFCRCCGVNPDVVAKSLLPTTADQNRSISANGLRRLRAVWGDLDQTGRVAEFERLRRFHHTGIEPKPVLISENQRREILTRHRDANRYLIERYGAADNELLNFYCTAS